MAIESANESATTPAGNEAAAPPRPSNFIRDIIIDDIEDRQVRRPRAHALSAGAERLSAHRPRQIDLPELRPRRRSTAASATCASTTPTREGRDEYVDSIIEDVRWLGFDWEDRLFYASDYFEQLYEWAVQLIKAGKAYVCDLTADADSRVPRHADRARQGKPVPQSHRRRESRPVRAHGERRVSRTARARCAPRSTWRRRTSTCAIR